MSCGGRASDGSTRLEPVDISHITRSWKKHQLSEYHWPPLTVKKADLKPGISSEEPHAAAETGFARGRPQVATALSAVRDRVDQIAKRLITPHQPRGEALAAKRATEPFCGLRFAAAASACSRRQLGHLW